MKDSCSTGSKVYELDGTTVIIHDVDTGKQKKEHYRTELEAQRAYERLAFLIKMGELL